MKRSLLLRASSAQQQGRVTSRPGPRSLVFPVRAQPRKDEPTLWSADFEDSILPDVAHKLKHDRPAHPEHRDVGRVGRPSPLVHLAGNLFEDPIPSNLEETTESDKPGPSHARQSSGTAAVTTSNGAKSAAEESYWDLASLFSDIDQHKESQRELMQTTYGPAEWKRHRSTFRYVRHVLSLYKSRIVFYLFAPSAFITSVAVLVGCYETAREMGDSALPDIIPDTGDVLRLMITALSLLLVFRTNASYARWLDARKMWGSTVNRHRDLMRQANAYFKQEEDKEFFKRWLITTPHAIRTHLTGAELTSEDVGFLLPSERELLLNSTHKPLTCLQGLTYVVHQSGAHPTQIAAMDQNLTTIEDNIGGCERILRSPIPLAYTRHTSRMLILWLLQLPFGLWHSIGWDSVPACFIISFFILGIEEIGVLIEEPFSLLPLTALCTTIKNNVLEVRDLSRTRYGLLGAMPSHPDTDSDSAPKFKI